MDMYKQMIEELKASKYPVILYGASNVAASIRRYLEKNTISIDGYIVDDDYLPKEKRCDGKPIYPLKEYTSQNDCNIILARVRCSEDMETELRGNKHIKRLYALDFAGNFSFDKDNRMSDEFYQLHKPTLDKLRADLCDEESKLHFNEFIRQKRTGCYRKKFSQNTQYFDKDLITLSDKEVFVDCGAYDGDTILSFIDNLKSNDVCFHVYAFEADSGNIEKLKSNIKDLMNVEIIPKGVYDKPGTLFFNNDGTTGAHVSDGGEKIEVTSIDEVVKDNNVTFIKMDIEGSELKALKGAEKTIKRCRPKLAICVYHKIEDLITIPQYIQSLNSDYKLYFRNYLDVSLESVLYAI